MLWNRVYALTGSAEGVMDAVVSADQADVTENAIENVQNITGMLHLPNWVGRLVFILLIILIAQQLLRLTNKSFRTLIDRVRESGSGSGTLLFFAHNIVRVLIYFFAAITIIYSIPGAKSTMNMLLASGGVIALILGVAAQDAMSNVAGGVMILAFKPFAIGDFVCYLDKSISGTVEEITLRHTVIRTAQNKRVIIPNGTINQSVLENADYLDNVVCEFYEVSITYESDLSRAIELLRDEVGNNPLYLDRRTPEQRQAGEPKVQVKVVELADSGVVLRAWIWAATVGDVFNLKFSLNESVKNRFDKEGIEFAYPHITVVPK
ncbi:MAG: mechanosensitive ion channel family protein [Butyricicoccus sp.]